MNRMFIRGLWGIPGDDRGRLYKRRSKISNDIDLIKKSKYQEPFVSYVFGEDNYNFLIDEGFNCVLIDKKPIVWDMEKQQFRHKLEIFKCGAKDYDEIIFLDWDTYQIKPLPKDFWDVVSKKSKIQATLRTYRRKHVRNRENNKNKIPCASYVYIKGEKTAQDIIDSWTKLGCPLSEELAMAEYMDGLMKNGFTMEEYERLFEPDHFYLGECQPFKFCMGDNYYIEKNRIFRHFNKRQVKKLLSNLNKYEWLKK